CFGLLAIEALTAACSSSTPTPPASPAVKTPLWGELKPIVSVKELMHDVISPAAEPLFKSVSIVINKKQGYVEREPKTDEDWEKVRSAAVTLAEGIYLLKIPRPIAPPGVQNDSEGPDAPELSPAEILAKLERDPVLWNARIEAVRNVGLEYLEI